MKLRRKTKALAAAAAAACLALACLAGCSSGAEEGQDGAAEAEKTLAAGSAGYFYAESMDPAHNWDGWEMQYYGITENLLRLTDDFDTEPWLAESVENADELTWVVTLRDDVMFSNGEKMTGDAVKACLERTYAENPRAAETLDIASIEAEGQTVTIVTKQPVPSFKNVICDPVFSIYYVGEGFDYAAETPCTGPYKVSEFVGDPEYRAVLVPNENYWNGTPKLDRISLTTYFDESAMTLALQNGELDILAMPPASAYAATESDARFQKFSQVSTRADIIRFNMAHPVMANDAVREAVSWCIDREGYAEVICGGTETPSYGVYSAQLPYGGSEGLKLTVDSFDPDKAAAVLDEAGIVDGDGDGIRELDGEPLEISLFNCTQYERFTNLGADLQSKLASIGVKLNITGIDYWLQDAETYNRDDPDMTIDSYGMAPTGDAGYFANIVLKTGGSANFGSYSNPEVDALIEELGMTFDEAERAQVIQQISQKVLDDGAFVFFSNSTTNYLATTEVSGIAVAPSEYYFITVDTDVA